MKADYCEYPPRVADDVEITENREGDRPAYIVGSASVGRYVRLGGTENNVLGLLGRSLTRSGICAQFQQQYQATLSFATLGRFLTRLDDLGILAGLHTQRSDTARQLGSPYFRIKLFNPDNLFARMTSELRWIWTKEFFVLTLAVMLGALGLGLVNQAELNICSKEILREHFVAIGIAGLLVGLSHEFAHGLTCKAFGGRSTELGVLMIYYFLPALYCNVSGIHSIPQRGRRLWVIAAGMYWQLLAGTVALLLWLVFAPQTVLGQLALIFFLGSVLDLFINANPLIKLDGYYFLSQWLRLPNLMERSRTYWRELWQRNIMGQTRQVAVLPLPCFREGAVYAVFGLLSMLYAFALIGFIVLFAGGFLVDSFYLVGLLLTTALVLWYLRRSLEFLRSSVMVRVVGLAKSLWRKNEDGRGGRPDGRRSATAAWLLKTSCLRLLPLFPRRRAVPLSLSLLFVGIMLMPWCASVGNYGILLALPDQEAIIRAPESATLLELLVRPGEMLVRGTVIGRMGSLELEDQTAEAHSDLARARTTEQRLQGEWRAQLESAARAEGYWRQRQHDHDELAAEQEQIWIKGSTRPDTEPSLQDHTDLTHYPAVIAVLEADVDLRHAQLAEASSQFKRARELSVQNILPPHELELAQTRRASSAIELNAARHRLEAALIEHRRKSTSAATEMQLAQSDLKAEQAQVEKLHGELSSTRALIDTFEQRLDQLQRRHLQLELIAPRAGTIFAEDLQRRLGLAFGQGTEICRVAQTAQLLVRIQVPETELGDVRVGHPVRLKARAFPDQLFRGQVSRIAGESEPDEHRRMTYRVELTIENSAGRLRPGMTAFARIDFDRQMIGRIILHKLRQSLRPELWML